MAGLLQQQPQPEQQPPERGPEQQSPEQDRQRMSEAYQRIVSMALDFLYSEPGVQSVMDALKMPGTPPENIGTVVARMIQRMWISAADQGKQIPPPIIMNAAVELTQAVTDMAVESGVVPKEQANAAAKEGFYAAMTKAGQETPNDILTPQERQAFQQMLQQINQMDEQHSGQQPQEQAPAQQEQPPMQGGY
jgi:hypothetical protein